MKYIARTNGTPEHGEFESCVEHASMVGCLASAFASSFGKSELGLITGVYHDLGKYSDEFQKHIKEPEIPMKVDHSTAGAQYLCKNGLVTSAFAIAGHHAGLPNGGTRVDNVHASTFTARMKKDIPDASKGIGHPDIHLEKDIPLDDSYKVMMFIRMLFSCLVDADRLDAEYFVEGDVGRLESSIIDKLHKALGPDSLQTECDPTLQILHDSVAELIKKFDNLHRSKISQLQETITVQNDSLLDAVGKSELNEKRCEILRQCINNGRNPQWTPGLYTLTAPTGSGKTNASLTFALEHAKTQHLDRVIYVIPYMSIIDQTVASFEKKMGPQDILPHYSEADFQLKEDDELNHTDLQRSLATENWDLPVIVTTAVQFFESIYSNSPARCRKMHNLTNSVIIFDEAQTLPVPFLRPCIRAIVELVKNYGASAIMCTATQPELGPIFEEFDPQLAQSVKEICPLREQDKKIFDRIRLNDIGEQSLEDLAEIVDRNKQALCVVNTRKAAVDLYDLTVKSTGEEGVYCLTTLLCATDRLRKLDEIRLRLTSDKRCIVFSTSLIEAGVDVDFPVAYRELTGLDSILQTAGRCNREGKRNTEESVVSVFSTKGRMPSFIQQNVDAFNHIKKEFGVSDLQSSTAIHEYFSYLLNIRGSEALDRERILDMHQNRDHDGIYPFKTISNAFHIIDTPTSPVYIPLDAISKRLCDKLLNQEPCSRSEYRKLGRYSVNLWPKHITALCDQGLLEVIDESSYVLRDIRFYNNKTGLQINSAQPDGIFI